MERAAVLIGVDATGQLPRLHDAAAGARRMEQWALAQGFERDMVHVVTDEREPVDVGMIKRAIRAVVGHPLGSVVAYNVLRRDGKQMGWKVPTFVTVGSPLGVTMIRDALAPVEHPSCVGSWFNAFDPADVVALHPLDRAHFGIRPGVENHDGVHNGTRNRHGIAGYLDDAVVARRIHDALVA